MPRLVRTCGFALVTCIAAGALLSSGATVRRIVLLVQSRSCHVRNCTHWHRMRDDHHRRHYRNRYTMSTAAIALASVAVMNATVQRDAAITYDGISQGLATILVVWFGLWLLAGLVYVWRNYRTDIGAWMYIPIVALFYAFMLGTIVTLFLYCICVAMGIPV